MKKFNTIATATALAVAAGTLVAAQSYVHAASDGQLQLADAAQMAAVKERQETMKAIGGNMKILADFVKESKGTAAEAEAAATKINGLAKTIPAIFEVEASLSEMDAVGKNRAKPEIWLNWDGFVEDAKVLEDRSMALAGAIKGGDAAAIQAAFGDMGKNGCGGCHDDFRGPKVE
jgi:cytochrome c556